MGRVPPHHLKAAVTNARVSANGSNGPWHRLATLCGTHAAEPKRRTLEGKLRHRPKPRESRRAAGTVVTGPEPGQVTRSTGPSPKQKLQRKTGEKCGSIDPHRCEIFSSQRTVIQSTKKWLKHLLEHFVFGF